MLDPIAVAILALSAMLAMRSTRATSYLNWIATAINMFVILFVIVAAFANANTENLKPFLPYGPKGVFRAAAVIYFAYGGYDSIATMAEETKNPSRDIPLGLLVSMSAITVIYCLMALALCMMQNYKFLDENAAFSIAFGAAGMHWAKYLVALGALKGITTVLLMGRVAEARYITHIARTHMIPPWFALVNEYTGTPINASLVMTAATACVAFFSSLDVLSGLISLSTLFIFMLMAVALLVRRHYVKGQTSQTQLHLLVFFLIVIVCSSVATSVYWAVSDGWVGYVVSIAVWLMGTGGIAVFGFCTAAMLIYYVLFGLHATYDDAHSPSAKDNEPVKPLPPSTSDVENGGDSQSAISSHANQPGTL
ncbi:hypothetical protein SUGI_0060310 [Cryptomeria japonica]|nr:hypothetical protein SUGI_0060310 [Cryptomeria japonica]